ncbi:hypothetical protein LPICM17_650039 [Lactococcus piscium]|nr:hypothetical protein LPICM17_650039 [Lactococcus piscium]
MAQGHLGYISCCLGYVAIFSKKMCYSGYITLSENNILGNVYVLYAIGGNANV